MADNINMNAQEYQGVKSAYEFNPERRAVRAGRADAVRPLVPDAQPATQR